MITLVQLSAQAKKDLRNLPSHVIIKLMAWVDDVENRGLEEVKKIPGYHDEPLKGQRKGEFSIRLSRSYRAIYKIRKEKTEFVSIEEVSKHEY
jgi:toxin HigB-1